MEVWSEETASASDLSGLCALVLPPNRREVFGWLSKNLEVKANDGGRRAEIKLVSFVEDPRIPMEKRIS